VDEKFKMLSIHFFSSFFFFANRP